MNSKSFIWGLFTLSLAAIQVANGEILDGGWRISAGAMYNSPVKTEMRFNPICFKGGRVDTSSFVPGMTRAQAKAESEGVKTGTRTDYNSGSWIDSADALGEPDRGTWNARMAPGTYDGHDHFIMGSASYAEVVTTEGQGKIRYRDEDEGATPGINVELSRNLYHNEEYHFGVDVAFGVSYFFRNKIFRSCQGYSNGTTTYKTGAYQTGILARPDPWSWNEDGSYGGGTFEGPGPVFSLGNIYTQQIANPDQVVTSGGAIDAYGDYHDLEMVLSIKPYYDIFEWWRIYGMVGVAVSRADFDLNMTVLSNGQVSRDCNDFVSWDVYGIAGLGTMVRWRDFCLGFDFEARFLDNEVEIKDRYVNGELTRGRWLFKLFLGYEF